MLLTCKWEHCLPNYLGKSTKKIEFVQNFRISPSQMREGRIRLTKHQSKKFSFLQDNLRRLVRTKRKPIGLLPRKSSFRLKDFIDGKQNTTICIYTDNGIMINGCWVS